MPNTNRPRHRGGGFLQLDGRCTFLTDNVVCGQITAGGTSITQLVAASGTNNVAKVAGGERDQSFTLTGVNGTSASFAGYVLEITQANFLQTTMITSSTSANPAVATLDLLQAGEAPSNLVGTGFGKPLNDGGNVTFIVYPLLKHPLEIQLDEDATGTLTLYRANGAVALNTYAKLRPGETISIPTYDISSIYYAFSVNAATEIFYWREGMGESKKNDAPVGDLGARVTRKSITFAGGTPNAIGDHDGTGDPASVFTVTGDVVVRIAAVCSTNLTFDANATIELGIAGSTAAIIAQTDLTVEGMIAQEIWHDATPDSEIEALSVIKEFIISGGNDVILTVGTANVTAGVIDFSCFWTPLSSTGSVVAA